ncbi:MAG TPA: outer membrane beta-barrel protein [Tepidisphaeraceae bacterium]|nr:outer membrane beta-barrel protein [Tepidisphaeraceae bacterium]
MIQRLLVVTALFLAPCLAAAQSQYSAERAPVSFNVGAAYSYFIAGYGGYKVLGPVAYATFSPVIWDHAGIEGEGRWLTQNGSRGFSEYNYLIGPVYRITLVEHRRFHPYVKGLVGAGIVNFPNGLAVGRYFAIAPGGGVDFTLNRHWRARADYEYQIWPGSSDIAGTSASTIKPNGVTVGLTYRVF